MWYNLFSDWQMALVRHKGLWPWSGMANRIGCEMRNLKCILAVVGLMAGVGAVLCLSILRPLTLKGIGIEDVGCQLVVQRVLTPMVFCALAGMAASAEWLSRRMASTMKPHWWTKAIRLAMVIVLPLIVLFCTLNTPFWSFVPPDGWNRPRFIYGWLIPWKTEAGMTLYVIVPAINWLLWMAYTMFVFGYKSWKAYRNMLLVMGGLLVVYAILFGVAPRHRGVRNAAIGEGARYLQAVADGRCLQCSTTNCFGTIPA